MSSLTKGFLSQVESGKSNPSLESLTRIAQALDTSATQLLARSGSVAAGATVPPTQPTLVGEKRAPRAGSEIQVLDAVAGGTHLLVDLSSNIELASPLVSNPATVVCVALEGSMRVTQAGTALALTAGDVAAWDGGTPYLVQSARNLPVRLLLIVPHTLPLPTLSRAPIAEPETVDLKLVGQGESGSRIARGAPSGDGPLRLVAMRAQRLAERQRTP
jgi:hypothetical protein